MIGSGFTDSLLEAAPFPPLEGPGGVAERMVMLVHAGVDWGVWGGARRVRYWDALTERVKAATYAGDTLSEWWADISRSIDSEPRSPGEREELAVLLAGVGSDGLQDQVEVVEFLSRHAPMLVLRCRVVSERRRASAVTGHGYGEDAR